MSLSFYKGGSISKLRLEIEAAQQVDADKMAAITGADVVLSTMCKWCSQNSSQIYFPVYHYQRYQVF